MAALIYINEQDELRAVKYAKSDEYLAFVATLDPTKIVFEKDETIEDNLPEHHKETYELFLASMKRQWGSTQYLDVQHSVPSVERRDNVTYLNETITPKKPRKSAKKTKEG